MPEAERTPSQGKTVNNFGQRVTSPYFPHASGDKVSTKRKRQDSDGSQPITPARVTAFQDEIYMTTSPYFSNTKAPPPRNAVVRAGTQATSTANPRKRKQWALRGDTPDEPAPPATPQKLSQTLGRIKPNLVQEIVRDDPWKIIVATTLLNRTAGKVAIPVFWRLIEQWPTPLALAQAPAPRLTELLRPVGTQSIRTSRLIRLSNSYVMNPPVFSPRVGAVAGSKSTLDRGQQANQIMPRRASRIASVPCDPPPCSESGTMEPKGSSNASIHIPASLDPSQPATPKQGIKAYNKALKSSPISHLPFTGPYAIDSFRIFSSNLPGGGAPSRVAEQLERIARLSRSIRHAPADDFDETPDWYDPIVLRVSGDEDAERRHVRPEDKELRRYLVWRWAIEGVAYDTENQTFGLADWKFLNGIIRR